MSLERSDRVSSQEEDLMARSTKKVKARDETDLNEPIQDMEIVVATNTNDAANLKASYKESLLTPPGPQFEGEVSLDDSVDENEPIPEDRWYQEDGFDPNKEKPFDPCPIIPISKDEFDEWCKPWHAAFIVKVLGK
ncbi:hypothetical protein PIB30_006983 [Stylosanthes scabra]|uniref:Uncharacterized protein n=1 Tax=Stylosanthes scabra TaxID=79078 RepID=A0ABU6Z266_9FABA|nr:hypothetical protein [Stylosanthes scabra]